MATKKKSAMSDKKQDAKAMSGMNPFQKASFKKADTKMDKKKPSAKADKKMDMALRMKIMKNKKG